MTLQDYTYVAAEAAGDCCAACAANVTCTAVPYDELNKWRLVWRMLLDMPIVREMYVFTAVARPKRLGHNVWLGLGILVVEWVNLLSETR
jgi:hypothetical protein